MLFTGAKLTSARVNIAPAGVVDHIHAGFACTSADALVTDAVNPPQNFIKGVGIRNTGAVCTTTTTGGTDTFSEGVRIDASGKLVIANSAGDHTCSGNPCTATGALATV